MNENELQVPRMLCDTSGRVLKDVRALVRHVGVCPALIDELNCDSVQLADVAGGLYYEVHRRENVPRESHYVWPDAVGHVIFSIKLWGTFSDEDLPQTVQGALDHTHAAWAFLVCQDQHPARVESNRVTKR